MKNDVIKREDVLDVLKQAVDLSENPITIESSKALRRSVEDIEAVDVENNALLSSLASRREYLADVVKNAIIEGNFGLVEKALERAQEITAVINTINQPTENKQ